MTTQPSASLTSNDAGALCYLLGAITGIAFLLIQPYSQDREVRFHAFQSIFLTVAWFILWMAISIITSISVFGFLYILTPLISLAGFVLWVYLMFQTYQGRKVVLPVIGPLAEQQAGR